jgi:plasmid maintenance system killer protein
MKQGRSSFRGRLEIDSGDIVSDLNTGDARINRERHAGAAIGDLSGAYSRRINIQHRLVYELFQEEKIVSVLRMWTYYE